MTNLKRKRRNTRQLEVIWDAIKNATSHPTADQIYEKVRMNNPNISLGTVYRNLKKLVAEKKLQVLTEGRSQRFDPMIQRHQHFICERCNGVYDVVVDEQTNIVPARLPHEGFTVTSHQLAFYGICRDCSA